MSKPAADPRFHFRTLFPARRRGIRFADLRGAPEVELTYNGRYAIYEALHRLASRDRKIVLVPAFHCPSAVDPVVHAGFTPLFYGISPDLQVDTADFLSKLTPRVAAAVFIRYFGLPSGVNRLLDACAERQVVTIDDCSHSFIAANPLRLAEAGADATIYSFKKLVPSVVGGGLRLHPRFGAQPARRSCSVGAVVHAARRIVGEAGEPHQELPALPDFRARTTLDALASATPAVRYPAEVAYPYDQSCVGSGMPWPARLVLHRERLDVLTERRRDNYRALSSALHDRAGFRRLAPELGEDTCPWGYPLSLRDRAAHDYRLRAMGVPLFTFGEILHPLLFTKPAAIEESTRARALKLSESLLVLAIHQDLDIDRMQRHAAIINAYLDHVAA